MILMLEGIKALHRIPEFKTKPAYKEMKQHDFDDEIIALLNRNKRIIKKNRLSQLAISLKFGCSEYYVYKLSKQMEKEKA